MARALVLFALLSGAVSVPAAGAAAQRTIATPAPTGPLRLAYTRGGNTIQTSNPDGSNLASFSWGHGAVVATGGRDIFFIDNLDHSPSNPRAIYRVGDDGSDLRLVKSWSLSASCGPENVDVSADTTRVVYDRYVGCGSSRRQLFIASADGTGEQQITNFTCCEAGGPSDPSFSPDGSMVVFRGCPNEGRYGSICTMPASGGPARLIAFGEDPRWGRSGEIVYTDLTTGTIWITDETGTSKRDTGIAGSDPATTDPALSPDGRQVAFVRKSGPNMLPNVWIAAVDGANQRQASPECTSGACGYSHPVWYPGTQSAGGPLPTASVTSPLSGTIVGGQPVTFTWSASGNIASQSIVLETYEPALLNGSPNEPFNPEQLSFGFTVVANLPGDVRAYTWTPPVNMQWTVRHARIAVRDVEGQVAVATGPLQGLTTRPAPSVPPYMRVAYPSDPGITWYVGQSAFASWRADDPDGIARSEVRLSTDGGVTYPRILATTTGNAASASFPVPNTPTTRARVKVTSWDTGGNAASATSANDFAIVGGSPTAVTVRSFTATRAESGVIVRWQTARNARPLGFHVYRQRSGKRVRLNKGLLRAAPAQAYSFRDRGAPRRAPLGYWLQVVEPDGDARWYGPAFA